MLTIILFMPDLLTYEAIIAIYENYHSQCPSNPEPPPSPLLLSRHHSMDHCLPATITQYKHRAQESLEILTDQLLLTLLHIFR